MNKEVFRSMNNMAQYGRGQLELPLSSQTEEFKCVKVSLRTTLAESNDTLQSRLL